MHLSLSICLSVCLGRRRALLWLCTAIGKWAENKHWVNDGHRHAVQHSTYYVDRGSSEYPVRCQGEALIHKQ